ncbi:MAG: ankyrin repeat domain-containing protein [Holophagales bacterium]|nr:ankyrin repeat domain-containing protein [Holophagales bacterium]
MAFLLAPTGSQVQARGAGAPPPSLERLLQAARTGDVAGVTSALSSGAPIDGGDPKWGETALMRAAAFGQRATVQALLSAGANPLVESAGKRTALHAAAEGGDVDILRDLLTKGLPVDGGADRGDTPLTVACAARRPAAIEALVAAGARHEAMGSDCGTLADLIDRSLANDTGSRDLPVIRAFIRARSGLEVAGRVSGTPIQAVVAGCHHPDAPEVARLLIDAGVDLEVKTAAGLTVRDEARRRLRGEPRCAATVAEFDRRGGRR